jgi:hypothetical protein
MRQLLCICAVLAWGTAAYAQSPATTSAPATAPAPATTAAPGGAANALPTAAELAKQVDDGQYRDVLKSLQRVLDLKGTAAAPYNRAEMLMLRAECLLQLRETQGALSTLEAAAKEARGNKDQVPDPDMLGKAVALTVLVNKSPNLQYTPKTHTGPVAPKPINILDRTARTDAFKALFDDVLPDAKAKVRATENAKTLQPILDLAKSIAALRAVEKAATDADNESTVLVSQLTTRATIMLGNSVADMSAAVDSIAANANQVYTYPIPRINPATKQQYFDQGTRRRGLNSDQGARLKTIQQNCAQTISACADLGLALDAVDKFRPIANDADRVTQKAVRVLNDDYRPAP